MDVVDEEIVELRKQKIKINTKLTKLETVAAKRQ